MYITYSQQSPSSLCCIGTSPNLIEPTLKFELELQTATLHGFFEMNNVLLSGRTPCQICRGFILY